MYEVEQWHSRNLLYHIESLNLAAVPTLSFTGGDVPGVIRYLAVLGGDGQQLNPGCFV